MLPATVLPLSGLIGSIYVLVRYFIVYAMTSPFTPCRADPAWTTHPVHYLHKGAKGRIIIPEVGFPSTVLPDVIMDAANGSERAAGDEHGTTIDTEGGAVTFV